MNEDIETNMFLSVLFLVSAGILFVVNYHYQRKARFYADEILKDNPLEFNKQIKANAYRNLFSSVIWAVLCFALFFWSYELLLSKEKSWTEIFLFGIDFLFGLFLIFWGIRGYQTEMKRIIDLT